MPVGRDFHCLDSKTSSLYFWRGSFKGEFIFDLFIRIFNRIYLTILILNQKQNRIDYGKLSSIKMFSYFKNQISKICSFKFLKRQQQQQQQIWWGTHTTFSYPALQQKEILLSDLHSYLSFVIHSLRLNEQSAFLFIALLTLCSFFSRSF